MRFGATFSEPYAQSLGIDPEAAYQSLIHEIGLDVMRLCTYWDRVEPEPGRFDFSSLDWQIEGAEKAGLDIILTVGQKAPRWPEFHRPSWISPEHGGFGESVLAMVETVVRHFIGAPVSIWQVENEPYLSLGGPPLKEHLLRREIELVRALDGHPIMLTDSADKGDWTRSSRWCDILGVNLYTRVWNGRQYVDINVPPSTYKNRIRKVSSSVKEIIVSELQAEPWGPRPVAELTRSEDAITMSSELLRRNVRIAAGAGFCTALFWGVEWWYWLRTRGDPSMWEVAKVVVEEHR